MREVVAAAGFAMCEGEQCFTTDNAFKNSFLLVATVGKDHPCHQVGQERLNHETLAELLENYRNIEAFATEAANLLSETAHR